MVILEWKNKSILTLIVVFAPFCSLSYAYDYGSWSSRTEKNKTIHVCVDEEGKKYFTDADCPMDGSAIAEEYHLKKNNLDQYERYSLPKELEEREKVRVDYKKRHEELKTRIEARRKRSQDNDLETRMEVSNKQQVEQPISEAEKKAITLFGYVKAKCTGEEMSEMETDNCINNIRGTLNREGKVIFDRYFGR